MPMKRYYARVTGRVQGVGFRYRTVMYAQEMGVTGWVRNLDNGDVELEVQGEVQKLELFFSAIKESNFFVRVEGITKEEKPIKEQEKGFRVEY